jgi:hypothetical protein
MTKLVFLAFLGFGLGGCASKNVMNDNQSNTAPFQYAGRYLIKVPVTVNDSVSTFFIFDTGIGVNLLSKKLADAFGLKMTDRHTGHRMSGQEITIPMSTLNSMTFAGQRQMRVPVGIWEMKGFLPRDADCHDVEGFLSLGFFRHQAFTMDYKTGRFTIENEEGMMARRSSGNVIPITIDEDGPAITIFMPLQLPDGTTIKVEIDLGGNILTLNEKFMSQLGVDKGSTAVRVEKMNDETGHPYIRYFTKIAARFPQFS